MKKIIKWGLIGFVALVVITGIAGVGGSSETEPAKDDTASETKKDEPTKKAEKAKPAKQVKKAKPEPTEEPEPEISAGQERALAAAENYLDIIPQSQKALAEQLEFDGFSKADATWAAANVEADWNEQATEAAENYLDIMPQSKDALIGQLEFDGFTPAQAQHGANAAY